MKKMLSICCLSVISSYGFAQDIKGISFSHQEWEISCSNTGACKAAGYQNEENELWQMDMIHIREGSRYDGYFEKVAQRISEIMTDEIRETILRLKYETPETEKIIGVEYYQAVIRDGVRDYSGFKEWRKQHPVTGVVEWMP